MNLITSRFDNIAQALALHELPPEERERVLLDIGDLAFRSTLVRLLERLDEAGQDEFGKLMDADASEEELEAFLKDRVDNPEAVVEEALAELTDDILAMTQE
jgi:hypothetical protein